MRHRLRLVPTPTKPIGKRSEIRCNLLRERLPGYSRPEPFRVGQRPFERLPRISVAKVVQPKLNRAANGIGPVRPDDEPLQVAHDQQGRVFQRQRVLLKLDEGGLQVFPLALILPTKTAALPHVCPALAAGRFRRAALESVEGAAGVRFRRGRLV